MKKYLYVLIPTLKWFANFGVVFLVFNYLYTTPINKWVDMAVGWCLAFVVAAPFAYWAFHRRVLPDKQLAWFVGIWVVVTFAINVIVYLVAMPRPWLMLFRYEFAVQMVLEILAILVMARVMKRHQVYHETAEGIEITR